MGAVQKQSRRIQIGGMELVLKKVCIAQRHSPKVACFREKGRNEGPINEIISSLSNLGRNRGTSGVTIFKEHYDVKVISALIHLHKFPFGNYQDNLSTLSTSRG